MTIRVRTETDRIMVLSGLAASPCPQSIVRILRMLGRVSGSAVERPSSRRRSLIVGIRACLIVVKGRRPIAKEEGRRREGKGGGGLEGAGFMREIGPSVEWECGIDGQRKEGKATLVKREGESREDREREERTTRKTDDSER